MRSIAIAVLLCTAWTAPFSAVSSANQLSTLFQTTSHDFGTVAKAAKTEYRFTFENPYNQPIHVRSVRTSCGCTTPMIETETVPPGGRGSILARFNTGTHSGARAATVTVTFDRPSFSEVQLHVKGYIRTDVVFQPGEASFGNLVQGESKTIDVALDYAGKPNWKITNVTSDDKFVSIESKETQRQNGRVQYGLRITLGANAPAGPIESEVIIHTNDNRLTTVPLRLTANVLADIAVSPSLLSLGDLNSGDPLKQLIVLKGQQPFQVLSVESDEFQVQWNGNGEESKALHTLPLALTPTSQSYGQDLKGTLRIRTSATEKPLIEIGIIYRLKSPVPSDTSSSSVPSNPLRQKYVATPFSEENTEETAEPVEDLGDTETEPNYQWE